MRSKSFDEIAVQDIAEAATVNRATFYDHYTDKYALLEAMVAAHIPDYDYENRLLDLLRNLAEDGKRVEVISLLERLRSLSGMQELFDVLTHGHWSSTG